MSMLFYFFLFAFDGFAVRSPDLTEPSLSLSCLTLSPISHLGVREGWETGHFLHTIYRVKFDFIVGVGV